jgi:putative oxidoreductase
MTTTTSTLPASGASTVPSTILRVFHLADRIPLSVVQLASRVAIAHVFWNSAQSKLASWQVTQQLFAMEYHVPLIPPEIAAPLATATELCGAILLFFGLFARLGAAALLGMVTVIQLFVFPGNWGEHLTWASLLLLILVRGAGAISIDHFIRRYFEPNA